MPDPVRRGAARVATLVALPAALAAGAISLWILVGLDRAQRSPTATGPATATSVGPRASSPVTMIAPALAPDVAAVCRAIVATLPDEVGWGARRPVSAGTEQNAAYGDPPLTLACGTARRSVPPTADVAGLNGVCWYGQPGAAGTVWTTIDRVVPVTVTVPGPPQGSAQSVIAFSAAIAAADPRSGTAPSGCP